ncbi:septal ring lytic transglycosylase RlpA family protein [Terrihabitans sp. B22-R8]|uniref:septal ring lytic transglycosylase RlpA family protein n=1 Tax=Terrihabitans sp. B22-R8 TaxID=3425128 RepID=UPI00403CACC0
MIVALARGHDADTRRRLPYGFGGVCTAAFLSLFLANCTERSKPVAAIPSPAPAASESTPAPTKTANGTNRAYVVAGKKYTPQKNPEGYEVEGVASWYGPRFHGRRTSNGEIFDANSISAAHPTLPLPSYAKVTNVTNGRSIVVRVNDRGPFHGNRVVDVSQRTADLLDFRSKGMAKVKVEYVGPADERGSDNKTLLATLSEGTSSIANTLLAAVRPTKKAEEPASPQIAAAQTIPAVEQQPLVAAAVKKPAAAQPDAQPATKAEKIRAKPAKPAEVQIAEADLSHEASETTPRTQIASRIATGFAGMETSPPVLEPAIIGQPVLGSMGFSAEALRGSR